MKLKNILEVFALDAVFVIGVLLVFAFLRKKITFYLSLLGGYGSSINSLNPELDLAQAQELLQGLSGVASKTMWLLILAPVAVFLLYAVLEGLSFWVVRPREKYLVKFGLASLPAYLFVAIALYYLWLGWVMITLLLILGYLTFLFYLRPYWKGWGKLLKKIVMIPVFLGCVALGFLAASFFMLFYLESLILEYDYWFLVLGLIFLAGFSCFKVWVVQKFG